MAGPQHSVSSNEILGTPDRPTGAARWTSPVSLTAILCLFAVLAWSYWSTLSELVRIWDSSPDYSHGYLVVPLAAWFLWRRRTTLPWSRIRPSWWGLPLILLAACTRLVAARFYFPELDGLSLPLWLGGACWLLGGGAFAIWASPAVAFLLFMVPLPASIETLLSRPLQTLATTMSTWTLQSLGQPAIAEGTTILIDDHILEVERACSGLRMFYGILALAVTYVIVARPKLRTSVSLLAAVAPVAILANVARITVTGLLYVYSTSEAAQRFSHDLAGLLMIVLAVVLFGIVLWAVERTQRQFRRSRSRALLRTAIVLLVFAAIVPAGYFWHEHLQQQTVERFLRRANQLQESGNDIEAIGYLDRYLRVRTENSPETIDVRARLAQTADRVASSPLRKLQAMELYEKTWELDPDRIELGLRAGDLAIGLARFDDALNIAKQLATTTVPDPGKSAEAQRAAARLKALALLGRATAPDVVAPEADWQTIVVAFQEAIRANPSNIELPTRLADIYRHHLKHPAEAQRRKLADQVIDSMVARNNDHPNAWLARYIYRKSMTAAKEANWKDADADSDLDKALEIGRQDPKKESADVLLYAGQRASLRNESGIARKLFEQATITRPSDHRGWVRLGELIAAPGTDAARAEAVQIWNKGLESVSRYEIDLVLPLAGTLIELRRYADAEDKLRPLDAAIPHLIEPGRSLVELAATRLRAGSASAQGNVVLGTNMLRNVLNATRDGSATAIYRTPFADAWMQLGDYYVELRFDDQASEAYEAAGRLDANVPQWRSKAARAAERNGRPADAVLHFREAAEREPNVPQNWLALARAAFLDQVMQAPAQRNWQTFRTAFDQAVTKKANAVVLYVLEADFAAAQGDLDAAVKVLTKAAKNIPKSWEVWQALAVVQQRRKADPEVQKALIEFDKHVPNPESSVLFKARLASDAGHFDDARRILETGMGALSNAGKALVRNQLVELDLRQGNRGAARSRLEESAAQEPNNLQILETLGQVFTDDRDWKAVEELEARMKRIEGEDGTLWRESRARRLLFESVELDDPHFREAERLTREIAALRPSWQRRYVLEGVLARRQNQLDEAIAAYQQAIRLGNRSIGLSEELIDLLIEQRRFTEADREFQRVRQSVARSSRLSSVAIPIFVRRGESDEALRLAEDWVKRQPDDAGSQVRLGRTILLTSLEGSPDYGKSIDRARQAFERGVELAPTDVRIWISLFRFYTEVQKNGEAAGAMLNRLARRIDIPEPQKVFVLAQLYESMGNRPEAGRFYLQAIKLASMETQNVVLERAAQFFVVDDPAQSEAFCRQVLKRKAKSVEARRTLVRALAEQGGQERLREAAQILVEVGRVGGSTTSDRRLEAILLARTGRNEDRQRSIELLEGLVRIPQQAASQDRVLLASLYESDHRLMPAYDQLRAVSRQDGVAPTELVRYAEFLYRNTGDQPQFADQAEPILARLERDPQNRMNAFRLRLLAAKALPTGPKRDAKIRETIESSTKRFVRDEKDASLRRETFSTLLILLVREDLLSEAVRLTLQQSPCPDPVETAIVLADALTLLPSGSKLAGETSSFLRTTMEKNPHSADLLYSVANLRYVNGLRDEAIAGYRKALEAKPDHKLAMNNLATALADRTDGLQEALKTVDRALEKFGGDPSLLDTKGQVLVLLGRPEEGLVLLTEAASSRAKDAVVLLHLSNAYLAMGRPAEARAAYRRARAFNVAALAITPSDRAILERLENHIRQTAASGG